jgi:beta-glucosidase
MLKFNFPKQFIFGAATSAYQIEGGKTDCGKGESNWDRFCTLSGKILNDDTGEIACDHFHKYKKDIKLMKKIGLESYRFSISWARIIPDGIGEVNEEGIKFYSDLIDELIKNNIEPMLTLYHWDMPLVLEELGGFVNKQSIEWFLYYAKIIFDRFNGKVKKFITFNEPFVFTHFGYVYGTFPPGIKGNEKLKLKAAHNVLLAHGKTVKLFREMKIKGEIGITLDYSPNLPFDKANKKDCIAAELSNKFWAGWFYEAVILGDYPNEAKQWYKKHNILPEILGGDNKIIAEPIDFIGINHYFSNYVTYDENNKQTYSKIVKCQFDKTDFGWDITPEGFYDVLMYINSTTKLPIYITENGISLNDIVNIDGKILDYDRIDYMQKYLYAMNRAIENGANVKGYYYWSLMDNFEWSLGYKERFGLIYINYNTQKRTLKQSAKFYKKIINNKNS